MPPHVDPETVDRYLKVCMREQRGSTPGEQAAARRIRENMERDYPGVREAAGQRIAAEQAAAQAKQAGPRGAWGAWDGVDPESIRRGMKEAAAWSDFLGDLLGHAKRKHEADKLAEKTADIEVKFSRRDGRLRIVTSFDPDDLARIVERFDGEALTNYTDAVGARVAKSLLAEIHAAMEDDEDEDSE